MRDATVCGLPACPASTRNRTEVIARVKPCNTIPIKNYTTSISVDKTIGEIQQALRKAGASAVLVEYGPEGSVETVNFKLRMAHGEVAFRLPGRVDGVLGTLKRQRVEKRFQTREQAERVAWRIVKDWITAQIAICNAEIADMGEVFLPYADLGDGQTLYQRVLRDPGRALLALGKKDS